MGVSRFWMVWSRTVRVEAQRHDTEAAACDEADKLAADSPGDEFYVLEAIGVSRAERPRPTYRLTVMPALPGSPTVAAPTDLAAPIDPEDLPF